MNRRPVFLLGAVLAFVAADVRAVDARGYFRIGEVRLDVSHAVAVIEDASGEDGAHTWSSSRPRRSTP